MVRPRGYRSWWTAAQRPGYSGVAAWSRRAPATVVAGFGYPEFETEGRVLAIEYEDLLIFNVYFPNGKQSPERLDYKLRFCEAFLQRLRELRRERRSVVVVGDFNTAHQEIDLAHPARNARTSGFLPIEREWLDRLAAAGYVDTFRLLHSESERYTWWSPLSRARERNVGWRIDYFWASEDLRDRIEDASILSQVTGSDHCPVGMSLRTRTPVECGEPHTAAAS